MNACNLLQKHSCWGQLIRKRTSEPRGTINTAPSTCSPEPTAGIINKPVPAHHKVQTGLEAKKGSNWITEDLAADTLQAEKKASVWSIASVFPKKCFITCDFRATTGVAAPETWSKTRGQGGWSGAGCFHGFILLGRYLSFFARTWADQDMDVWPCTALTSSTEQLKD